MPKWLKHTMNPSGKVSVYKIHISGNKVELAGLADTECDVEVIPQSDGTPGKIIIEAKKQ